MLRKLLKYDLRASFKYWWILALSSVAISIFGGVCLNVLINTLAKSAQDTAGNQILLILSTYIGFLLAIVGLFAFVIVAEVFIYIRFYKNLFSDEGYLTFTLPVRRSQILLSKLLMASITLLCSSVVLSFDLLLMFLIAAGKNLFTTEFWRIISLIVEPIIEGLGVYTVIYGLELIIFNVLSIIVSVLLICTCITVGATIVKRAKVLVGIGIYYVVNSVISAVVPILFYSTFFGSAMWFMGMSENQILLVIALAFFLLIVLFAAIALALYTLLLYLMDRKLNLA